MDVLCGNIAVIGEPLKPLIHVSGPERDAPITNTAI
jgi:hypothetical protein